jgi:hypothetical protein
MILDSFCCYFHLLSGYILQIYNDDKNDGNDVDFFAVEVLEGMLSLYHCSKAQVGYGSFCHEPLTLTMRAVVLFYMQMLYRYSVNGNSDDSLSYPRTVNIMFQYTTMYLPWQLLADNRFIRIEHPWHFSPL